MHLIGEVAAAVILVETTIHRLFQRLQGAFKSGRRRFDGANFRHNHPSRPPEPRPKTVYAQINGS